MRIALTALLAFAAGVLVMLTIGHYRAPTLNGSTPTVGAPAHATSMEPAEAGSVADNEIGRASCRERVW